MFQNNPVFTNMEGNANDIFTNTECATYKGITTRTLMLLFTAIAAAAITIFNLINSATFSVTIGGILILSFVQFFVVIYSYRSLKATRICAIIYAIAEGAMLGFITLLGEIIYPGVAVVAIGVTLVIFFVMLALFATGVIRNSSKLMSIGMTMVISALVLSLLFSIISIFSSSFNTFLVNNPSLIILLSLVFLAYGAIMLLSNFSQATHYVQNGLDKDYEWRVAFGLSITIMYIYLQVLRIIILIAASRD